MLKGGGCDPPSAALRPPQSGGEPLVRPARGPVFVLFLGTEGLPEAAVGGGAYGGAHELRAQPGRRLW